MRNPPGVKAIQREWLGGMNIMDMGAAAGGLLASTMLPNYLVVNADSTGKKVFKVILSFASAAGAGFIFRNVSATAGKSAVAGGVAGAVVQAIAAFTSIEIGGLTRGNPGSFRALPPASVRGRSSIGESRYQMPGTDTGVQISVT